MDKAHTLRGLVLAGGKSLRMGQDKARMNWHGKEQYYHVADLLAEFCEEVFISCRLEQQSDILSTYKTLPDNADGKGPLVGIRSAFKRHPQSAWLVVACDLPLLDANTLRYLIDSRNTTALATTFSSPFDGLPEPLITIWETASSTILDTAALEGFSCPRKILIRNKERVEILTPPDADALLNANTPEDAARVAELMAKRQHT